MNRYLFEVDEITTHLVTIVASDEETACKQVLNFQCEEVETMAPIYQCKSVKRLGDNNDG